MKIKLYFGMEDAIKKSGIGRAFVHQKTALTLNHIDFTVDKDSLDYDILHINTITPDSIFQIRHARINGKKVIYHAHSTEEDFRNSFKFSNTVSGLYKKWLVYLYSSADVIITPTPYSQSLLESYHLDKPIYHVSNGVNLDDFNPSPQQIEAFCQQYHIMDNDIIVISVGWLFERKGFDTYVVYDTTSPAIGKGGLLIDICAVTNVELNVIKCAKEAGARIGVLTAHPENEHGKLADFSVFIPGQIFGGEKEVKSIQPMASLLEQSMFLFVDIIVMMLIERNNIDISKMHKRHTNLEGIPTAFA